MAVTVVGQATATSTSVTLPTHLAGDLVLVWAFQSTLAGTLPSAPDSSWITLSSGGDGTTLAYRLAYRVAPTDNSTSGSWVGASRVTAVVFRGQQSSPVIASAFRSGTITTHSVPAIAPKLNNTGNSAIIKIFQNTAFVYSVTAPSGYTRILQSGPVVVFRKNDTTSDAALSFSNGSASNWRSAAVEISEPTTAFANFF